MKPFVINTKSWHYRMVDDTFVAFDDANVKDFCSYVRWVVGALLLNVTGVFLFVSICVVCLFSAIRAIYLIYTHSASKDWGTVIFGLVVWASPVIIFLFIKWRQLREKRYWDRWEKMRNGDRPEPGFVAKAWRSFRDKTCYRVEFTDNQERT